MSLMDCNLVGQGIKKPLKKENKPLKKENKQLKKENRFNHIHKIQ
jgi:hypothetical protein